MVRVLRARWRLFARPGREQRLLPPSAPSTPPSPLSLSPPARPTSASPVSPHPHPFPLTQGSTCLWLQRTKFQILCCCRCLCDTPRMGPEEGHPKSLEIPQKHLSEPLLLPPLLRGGKKRIKITAQGNVGGGHLFKCFEKHFIIPTPPIDLER